MIAVTGARGFIGRAVCGALAAQGHRVLTIGRGEGVDLRWPPHDAEFDGDAIAKLEGTRAVVNLAGESISSRWTAARKREIVESRVNSTTRLARALTQLAEPPRALVSASAVGYYGNCGDEWLEETSAPGTDFLAGVCRAWEGAALALEPAGVRVVRTRFGVVLGRGGGMLDRVRLPFSVGLGGRLGSGTQWMSWVSLDDLVAFIVRAVDDESVSGAVNVVSPAPVTNAEFTAALASALRRPAVIPVPRLALRAIFGEMADEVLLASQRVRPARLLALGHAFQQATVEQALHSAFAGANG